MPLSANQLVVVSVRADPKPMHASFYCGGHGAMVKPDARAVEATASDGFEMK